MDGWNMVQTKCEHGYFDQYAFVVLPLLSASFPHYIYCVWFQTIGPPQQLQKNKPKKENTLFWLVPKKLAQRSHFCYCFLVSPPPQKKVGTFLIV